MLSSQGELDKTAAKGIFLLLSLFVLASCFTGEETIFLHPFGTHLSLQKSLLPLVLVLNSSEKIKKMYFLYCLQLFIV